ncbi:MAG: thioredoxin family protein [Dehalococcoidia bacterium]|jgi:hypothetical protein|nr:thioredoxin family protein [Dehalococcoidia bacterium]
MEVRFIRPIGRNTLAVLILFVATLAVACGGAATTAPTEVPAAASPAVDGSGLKTIVATKELGVGKQRVAFLLTSPKALVKVPEVVVTSVFLGEGQAVSETKSAEFHLWPYGVRGSYVTEMNFDRPGQWRLDIVVEGEGVQGKAEAILNVSEQGGVPNIGSIPPLSRNKTLRSVESIEKLTTDYAPDPDLYQITVEDAVATGKPTVVVFASPAFCTSPTCGPQTATLSELKSGHVGEANFIHVEIYDNPDEIQGDLTRAMLSQPIQDWGISGLPDWFNESWTFVLDSDGRVSQRFEGFATLEELESALRSVLPQS